MRTIALLGATGSIGRQALEIIDSHPELELVAAASRSQPIDGLPPPTQVGGDLVELLEQAEPDVVLNAVVGFAGLPATLWTLENGADLALANKESLVAAGALALRAWERGGGRLLPVDSEHSALYQCLENRSADQIESLVLTASGGPFRGKSREELTGVTPTEALAHPTWNIHSLVRFRDGAALAHLGYPDMRVPISFALTYPERAETPVPTLDLASGLTLEFHAPDSDALPMLTLAREAGIRGGTYPCAFNAANEVAVAAFLDGRIGFLEIAETVERTLDTVDGAPAADLDELTALDAEARRIAETALQPA